MYSRGKPKGKERKTLESYFGALPGKKHFQCTLCDKELFGMGEKNFVSNGKAHLRAKHSEKLKQLETQADQKQFKLSATGEPIKKTDQTRQSVSLAFAQTTHPINIFRNVASRNLLAKLIEYGKVPDYRAIQNDISELVQTKLRKLQTLDYYGVQLDHWSNVKSSTVLLVSISHITKKWAQHVQIVDFREVENTKSATTAKELLDILKHHSLDPLKCLAWQSDNCHSMIAAFRTFKETLQNETETTTDTFVLNSDQI